MIDILDLKIDDCYGTDFLYITFTVSNMIKLPENYRFDLYRAMNQNDFFVKIAEDISQYRYIDRNVSLLNPNVYYYYKIKITDVTTGEVSESDIYRHNAAGSDRWSEAIIEVESRYLEHVVGNTTAYLLQKRRTGPRCSCYNPNRRDSEDANCELCYGTGIYGGYYDAVPVLIGNYNADSFQRNFSIMEDADNQAPDQIWVKAFPKVENDDIIVDGDTRYIVMSHTDTMKNHFLIRQICNIVRIPRTNIASKIPVIKGARPWQE